MNIYLFCTGMKISLFNQYFNNTQNRRNVGLYPNLAPLKRDTVSFGAMKKSQFEGIDFAVIEKFKAPIEKFKTNEDLQNWCAQQLDELIKKDYSGRQPETTNQRECMLKEWTNYVLKENGNYTNAMALLILSAVTRDLKSNNDNIPPVLNKGVLADCISDISKNLKANKKYNFDFNKMYNTKLRALYLEDTDTGESGDKWVKIPSKTNDPEHFEENVEKLKALSHKNWCTKSFNAEPYLKEGDFHVYLQDGRPKLGVRFVGDKIKEIQGPVNNNRIPVCYLDTMTDYIEQNNFNVGRDAKTEISDAAKIKDTVEKIANDLKDAIKNNDVKTILGYFHIDSTVDKDGFYTISNYCQPSDDYNFTDIGVDEQRMFSKIKKIDGRALFENSALSKFTTLEEIGGDAIFNNSKISNLGSLKIIGRDANFKDSLVKDLGSLEEVGRNLILNDEITDLNNLEYIGNNVDFAGTSVTSLGNLEEIGGNAKFRYSQITNLGNLRSIGYVADFSHSKIKSLGNLETIGSDAIFENSEVVDLGNLREIDGDIYIGNSKLTPADFENYDEEELGTIYDDDDDDFYSRDFDYKDIVHGRIFEDADEYYD